jgi:hypothetical protein
LIVIRSPETEEIGVSLDDVVTLIEWLRRQTPLTLLHPCMVNVLWGPG